MTCPRDDKEDTHQLTASEFREHESWPFESSPTQNTHRWTPIREPLQQSSWNLSESISSLLSEGPPRSPSSSSPPLQLSSLSGCQAPTKHFTALISPHTLSGKHSDRNELNEVCKWLALAVRNWGAWAQPLVPASLHCPLHGTTSAWIQIQLLQQWWLSPSLPPDFGCHLLLVCKPLVLLGNRGRG